MDIVERLKLVGIGSEINSVSNDRAIANEAADEIEQLREEIEYLKAQAIHDQYKAESEGEERGYRMGYVDGLADARGSE